jgi:hypothetical protein
MMQNTRFSFHILIEIEIFSTDFLKNTPVSNFVKILPVGAELFYKVIQI